MSGGLGWRGPTRHQQPPSLLRQPPNSAAQAAAAAGPRATQPGGREGWFPPGHPSWARRRPCCHRATCLTPSHQHHARHLVGCPDFLSFRGHPSDHRRAHRDSPTVHSVTSLKSCLHTQCQSEFWGSGYAHVTLGAHISAHSRPTEGARRASVLSIVTIAFDLGRRPAPLGNGSGTRQPLRAFPKHPALRAGDWHSRRAAGAGLTEPAGASIAVSRARSADVRLSRAFCPGS